MNETSRGLVVQDIEEVPVTPDKVDLTENPSIRLQNNSPEVSADMRRQESTTHKLSPYIDVGVLRDEYKVILTSDENPFRESQDAPLALEKLASDGFPIEAEEEYNKNRSQRELSLKNSVKGPMMSQKTVLVKDSRQFYINRVDMEFNEIKNGRAIANKEIPKNKISTTKYNCATFLPLNLLEQFRKMANAYFLLIMVLQLIPGLASQYDWVFTLLPLTLVVGVSMIKDAYEDNKRRKKDKEENQQRVLACDPGTLEFSEILSEEITVGSLVKIRENQPFPCDLILIESSLPRGTSFVETKQLDGETNLKQKTAEANCHGYIKSLLDMNSSVLAPFVGASIECEGPNEFLYRFQGKLTMMNDVTYPLDENSILLKGSSLRNTEWVIGVAVFTGHDTKIMQNSAKSRPKRSKNAKALNSYIIICMCLQLACSVTGALINALFQMSETDEAWYLEDPNSEEVKFKSFIGILVTETCVWFITLMNFVPISLLVTLEMINFIQAYFITVDIQIYDEERDIPAVVQSSNLNEELGMVHYIFSDKTGTLTQNIMEFQKMSVGPYKYGVDEPPSGITYAPGVTNVNFFDPNLLEHISDSKHEQHSKVHRFLEALGLCHTVISEENTTNDGQKYFTYNASSPDELALVNGARSLGFAFEMRDDEGNMLCRTSKGLLKYKLLKVIEFDSNRKRMSVIVRTPDSKILVICKGADSILEPRLRPQEQDLEQTKDYLTQFSVTGLRTLLVAGKEITQEEYDKFKVDHHKAAIRHDKDKAMEEVASALEQNLELLGSTAIEDKLQEDVAQTIYDIRQAGIQVWVLTGDKVETAINIGLSCKLLDENMNKFILSQNKTDQILPAIEDLIKKQLGSQDVRTNGVIVTGDCLLRILLHENIKKRFIDLCEGANVVLACRVSPKQKAEIVEMIKQRNPKKTTLSIGDGANDVNMIVAAHIGIGISGREGQQATRAADYAIGKFKFLKNLLFVHGRENYRRNSFAVCYIFYKNILLTTPLFFYGFYSAFSGTLFYHLLMYQGFNTVFTTLPIIWFACMDFQHPKKKLLSEPELYKPGLYNVHFKPSAFISSIFYAIIQAIMLTAIVVAEFSLEPTSEDGKMTGYAMIGNFVFCIIAISVNIKLLMNAYEIGAGILITTLGSTAVYFLAHWFESFVLPTFDHFGTFYQLTTKLNHYLAALFFVLVFAEMDRVLSNVSEVFTEFRARMLERRHKIKDSTEGIEVPETIENNVSNFRHRGFSFAQEPGNSKLVTEILIEKSTRSVIDKLRQIEKEFGINFKQ